MNGKRSVRRSPLDCSRPSNCLFWFVVGSALASAVMSSYASRNWPSLLHAGSRNPLLAQMELELGAVASSDPTGHDGQLYYLIARDPLGVEGTPEAIAAFDNNSPRYRYRRILFPLLAGGFGQLGGHATLAGMILWLALAMGGTTAAIADLGFQLRRQGGTVIVATLNAGAAVSLLLLTGDVLAMALALTGIALLLRSRMSLAATALALAALTKETYLLVPISLAGWLWQQHRHRHAVALLMVSAAPLIIWSAWISASIPSAPPGVRNVGLPFMGLAQAIPVWIRAERNPVELSLIGFVAVIFAGAATMSILGRNNLLRWLIAPWLVLACLGTLAVWGKPNNIARAFAFLWPLTVLFVSERFSSQGSVSNGAPVPSRPRKTSRG